VLRTGVISRETIRYVLHCILRYKWLTSLLEQVTPAEVDATQDGDQQLVLEYSRSDGEGSHGRNGDPDVDKSHTDSDVILTRSSKRKAAGSENPKPTVTKNPVKMVAPAVEISDAEAVGQKQKGKTALLRTAKSKQAKESSAGKQKRARSRGEESQIVDDSVCWRTYSI
jgi:hypothetical protein